MSESPLQRARSRQRRRIQAGTLPPGLRRGELERLTVLLRHATGGAWAIALYNTVAVRDQVMEALRSRLAPLPVYDFTFTAERANPLAYLEQLPAEVRDKRTIIFLYDLTRGGEQVWGYLEMQREALADHPHGLIFWLTMGERGEAVHRAPNFWSQRSGVFDFSIADEAALVQVRGQWAGQPVRFADRADWERQVRLYRGLLEEYEQSGDVPADTLLDLYNKLSRLHYAVSDYRRAGKLARRQLALAKGSGDRRQYAEALNNIGLVYRALGDNGQALEYYEQALPIRQEVGNRGSNRVGEATTLYNMAMVYETEGNYAEAVRLLEQAVAIDETTENPTLESHRTALAKVLARMRR